jgi:SAM-dependent methyltransferase
VTGSIQAHWDKVYGSKAITDVSWYEAQPARSLELIRATDARSADPIIDVGSGASLLIDELLDRNYLDLTVLDISAEALQKLRDRLGPRAAAVAFLQQDVTLFEPARRYALWHDRAVFHFLTEREDRQRYVESLGRALMPNGHVIIATFGPSGPERCSGFAVMRYDANALAGELGIDFELADSSLVVHRTPGGIEQQFLYCRFNRRAPGESW